MSQTERLIRRNGIWHYRRKVPSHLVEAIGRREIHHTLGTSKLKEARRLRAVEDIAWDSRFRAASDEANAAASAPAKTLAPFSAQEVLRRMEDYVAEMDVRTAEAALRDRRAMKLSAPPCVRISEAIRILEQTPHSVFWNYDAIGYIAMGFACLLVVPAISSVGFERWVRRSLIANVLATPLISIVYFSPTFSTKLLFIGFPRGITAPLFMLMLAIMLRKRQSASTIAL